MRYEKGATGQTELYSHTPNVNGEGEYTEYYPISFNKTFVYNFVDAVSVTIDVLKTGNDSCCGPDSGDYFSFWSGSYPEYTALADWDKGVKLSGSDGKYVFGYEYDGSKTYSATLDSDSLTVSYTTSNWRGTSTSTDHGLGYYARITATDADGNPAYTLGNVPYSGTYLTPATAEYENYEFLGWSADSNATSADFVNAADIEANMSLNAGEKITLYAVWSPIVNISYDSNNATVGSMESTYNDETVVLEYQDVIAGKNIDLYAPNYKKDGYGFAGWSTDQDAWNNLTDDDETNDPTIYGPNQSFTLTKNMTLDIENGNMVLYAVWVPAEQNNGTPVALQDWQGCSNLTATTYDTETGALSVGKNTITALTDNRDGNIYTVARLADGNCWMTENLRLDNEATIATANTNNPLTVDNTVAIKNNDGNTTSAHLSPTNNGWCTDGGACIRQSFLNTNNINFDNGNLTASYKNDDNSSQWYSYGNYYNWYSATAGQGTDEIDAGHVTTGDVCPVGWHLPYGGSGDNDNGKGNISGGFYYLNQKMDISSDVIGSNKLRSFPNNFVYSGYWWRSSASGRGGSGYYWSSTAGNSGIYLAYYLGFTKNSTSAGPGNHTRPYGFAVRCVAPVE